MKTVSVHASKSYDVKIGRGLLSQLGAEISSITQSKTAVIVSDTNVWPLWGDTATASLQKAGFCVYSFVFPAGESSKCAATYLSLLEFLAGHHMTRSDCLVALGGGVVGDLTGFAAATYLRGIAYVQVPTTLLAAVDSSVGGKTAIDLSCGKNLVGAFYQPNLVLCDIDTLNTLPAEIFRDGCAEVIKYGILYDPSLFAHLQEYGLDFDRESVISRCVALKRDVVAADEFDNGARMKLNLGHTIGHGIEAAEHYGISHGKAVAIGTACICRAAAKSGICTVETCDSVQNLLAQFGLPIQTDHPIDTIMEAVLSDKKRSCDTIHLVLPEEIGRCTIQKTSLSDAKCLIEAGLSYEHYDLSNETAGSH